MLSDMNNKAVFGDSWCASTNQLTCSAGNKSVLAHRPIHQIGEELVLVSEKGELKKYLVRGRVDLNNESSAKVFNFGNANERPTKCILLLGETGAGKTTFVNATFNHLHNIKFTDNYRYFVEDQVTEDRSATESQTDCITVFKFHHKEGMKYNCNFVIIDTPGLNDTRDEKTQSSIMKNLEELFLSDYGIDDLHCLGLTTNATINRRSKCQRHIIDKILSLLGKHVPDITYILATHATEKAKVDKVMKSVGVTFSKIYEFDNHAVFAPNKLGEDVSLREFEKNVLRWEDMQEQYTTFLSELLETKSVSVRVLREKKHLDITQRSMEVNVEKLAMLWATADNLEKQLKNHKFQMQSSKDYNQEEEVDKTVRLPTNKDCHAHNCSTCNQTCNMCLAKDSFGKTVLKYVNEYSDDGVKSVKSFVPDKMVFGLAGALGGGTFGVGKAIQGVNKTNCSFNSNPCSDCGHSLQEHRKENETIKNMTIKVPFVNYFMKKQFDEAVLKMKLTSETIDSVRLEINGAKEEVAKDCLNMMDIFKTVQKLSPTPEPVTSQGLIEQVTPVIDQESDHCHKTTYILQALKHAIHTFDMVK